MNDLLEQKLHDLPKTPGVYFHKDATGAIIYVGKAAVLHNRVRQYFQASRARDPKTEALVAEIADTDWMVVDSELEALFLEAEMIRRYMPRYNILLRDDKSMSYIRIDYDSDYPTVTTTRRPLDDGARYFGPYFSTQSVRQALKLLRRIFPFATRRIPGQKRTTLHYHLGLDPGLEEGKTSLQDYRTNLRKLMAVIEGKRAGVIKEVERDMNRAAKAQQFELAAKLRNQLLSLQSLGKQVVFSDKEFLDISKDHALNELVDLLGLPKFPRRIEGYDISHMQGTNVVASMVVFTNGVSDKSEYRKFKTLREHNNDFYNMNETIKRRLSEKNIKAWGEPDLFLIDGGKGQLDAATRARDEAGQGELRFIGLAKREEQIVIQKKHEDTPVSERAHSASASEQRAGEERAAFERSNKSTRERVKIASGYAQDDLPSKLSLPTRSRGAAERGEAPPRTIGSGSNVTLSLETLHKLEGYVTETNDFILLNLPHHTNVIKLLQRIRDESHRFAVSYHSTLKVKQQTSSLLEDVPGIGPATRKKLIKTFGSLRSVLQASDTELVEVIGTKRAKILRQYIIAENNQLDEAKLIS